MKTTFPYLHILFLFALCPNISLHAQDLPEDHVEGFPSVTGEIYTTLPDGEGGWFLGGAFSSVGEEPVQNLAHLGPDLSLDPGFRPNPNGAVRALAMDADKLYVGGTFQQIAGQPRAFFVRLLLPTGNLDDMLPANPDGAVYRMELDEDRIYLGGAFTGMDGDPRYSYFSTLDKASGALLPGAVVDGPVYSLAQNDQAVFAGGDFQVAFLPVAGAATFTEASDVPLAGFPEIEGSVHTAISDGHQGWYLGGARETVGGLSIRNMVHILADHTIDSDFLPNPDEAVKTLFLDGGSLYAGGSFSQIGGLARSGLARLSTSDGSADPAWAPVVDQYLNTILADADLVYLGGSFDLVNGIEQSHFAALSKSDGSLLPSPACQKMK